MAEENKIVINNQEYKVSDLTEEAKTQINNLQVTDQEISRQSSLAAMLNTARAAYGQKLAEAMKDIKPLTKVEAKAPASKAKTTTKTAAKK